MKIGEREAEEYCEECNVFSDVQKITIARRSVYLCQDCKEVLFVMLCQKNVDMDTYTERRKERDFDEDLVRENMKQEIIV